MIAMRKLYDYPSIVLLCAALLLGGCTTGTYWEPDTRIARLSYQPDSHTLVGQLRIRNPGERAQTLGYLKTRLWLSGESVLTIEQTMNLNIPGNGVELVSFETPPVGTAVRWLIEHRQPLPYVLLNEVSHSEDGRLLRTETEGLLDATPGVENQYR